jgi:hypothetical protein
MKINYILASLLLGMLIGAVSANSMDPYAFPSIKDGLTKHFRTDPLEADYLVD